MRPISTSSMAAAVLLSLSHCCHWTVITATATAEEQPTCTSTGECTDDDNIDTILPAAAAAASSDTNTKPDTNTANKVNNANNNNANQCQLYLAPSTLPHAGLGLYAGGTSPIIPPHQSISTHRDLVLPILDPYKAHPHRGQQRFPSYLAYTHPKHPGALATELHNESGPSRAFPTVPQVLWDMDTGFNAADGVKFYWEDVALNDLVDLDPPTNNNEEEDVWEEPMNAFVPGLTMLVNHHCELNNMDRLYSEDREEDDSEDEEESDGAGIEYVALKTIRAGMELLIDYGPEYDKQNDLKLSYMERQKKRTNNIQHRQKQGHIHGIDTKWDRLDKRELYQLPDQLPTERAKRERQSIGFTKDSSEATTTTTTTGGGQKQQQQRPFSEYRENTYLEFDENDDDGSDYRDVEGDPSLWVGYPSTPDEITKSLAWLGEHGVCLLFADKLAIAPSNNNMMLEQGASGRGLYATSPIQKGETIVTSPLVAMREEDFVIYKSNPEQEFKRNILDKTHVLGKEVLLNYAFAHPDSPLYLVPTAPLANFMNHGGGGGSGGSGGTKKNSKPNVQIRWPEGGSNTAKLFEWAYNQPPGSHFQSSFEEYYSTTSSSSTSSDSEFRHTSNPWLESHPIDVMERSGKLALEYVALRDIEENEELLIDYGELWERAWESHISKRNDDSDEGSFRHPIGVPSDFYPDNWLHVTDQYEIAELQDLENNPLPTGEAKAITYAHNGKPVGSKYAYVIGLKQGFSDSFLKFAEENGVIELYRKLLTEQDGFKLESDAFRVYDTGTLVNKTSPPEADTLEFFAHRYATAAWNLKFNMHYAAAWNDAARRSVLAALGDSGFDEALNGIGQRFGYDNMTCFHGSFMGLTHCEKSIMHTDIYATNDQSWNMVFPLITVDGTEPELDIMAEDMNTVIGVHYTKDVVYAMGDWGYHQTRPMAYYNPEDDPKDYGDLAANGVPIRVVFGAYCSQIDETNVAAIRHIYDGDDPAPFADQFVDLPTKEIHWDRATGSASLAKPRGRGT